MERKNFTIRINVDLAKAIKKQAIEENRSVSDIINELITKYIQEKKALD